MDNLRLILIVAAIGLIGGIFIWDRIQSRKAARRQTVSPISSDRREHPGLVISAKPKDEDIDAALEDLDGFFIDSEPEHLEDGPGEIFVSRDPNAKPVRGQLSESRAIPEQEDAFPDAAPEAVGESSAVPGTVISLFIVATSGREFSGADIQATVDALGFEFGEMNIFHHRGTGELIGTQPLFSLVNMYEPGYFEPDQMDVFRTRGLSVFLQLPMKQDPAIVFPFMLEMTRRMAKRLGGELLGPGRKPLDQTSLDAINKLIGEYAG